MSIVEFGKKNLARLGLLESEITKAVERLGMSPESASDTSVELDITPNRPDLLDITGFARAALLLSGKKVPKEKHYAARPPVLEIKVEASAKKARPFIAAAVAKGVNLTDGRLKDLINFTEKFCDTYGRRRKKVAIGLHNLDAIQGNLAYGASKDGTIIPLGQSDPKSFGDVLAGTQQGKEYSSIIGKGLVPFIKDSKKTISMVPIINSEQTRVTESVRNLLVEITGTSLSAVSESVNLISCSLMDAGADIFQCSVSYGSKAIATPSMEYRKTRVRSSAIERSLGVYMDESTMVGMANRLGHVAAKYGNSILVFSPPYRVDVLGEQDIVEDIAIAYGYDRIDPMPVIGHSIGMPEESALLYNRLSSLMLGLGFTEAMNPYLTNERLNFEMLGDKPSKDAITIEHSKTESITMMRTTLLPALLQNLSSSSHDSMPQRLFEVGSVFRMGPKPVEGRRLGMVSEHSRSNYSEAKAAATEVLRLFGIEDLQFRRSEEPRYIRGRAALVMDTKGTRLGAIGEINPEVLENFGIEEPVAAAEIDVDAAFGV